MSSLIQSVMEHQYNDNEEIEKTKTKIKSVQLILNSTHEQIRVTQNELNNVCLSVVISNFFQLRQELEKLRHGVGEAEKEVSRKKGQKTGWIVGAVLALNVSTA